LSHRRGSERPRAPALGGETGRQSHQRGFERDAPAFHGFLQVWFLGRIPSFDKKAAIPPTNIKADVGRPLSRHWLDVEDIVTVSSSA